MHAKFGERCPEYIALPMRNVWRSTSGNMEDEGEEQVIATFQSVTGEHGVHFVCTLHLCIV